MTHDTTKATEDAPTCQVCDKPLRGGEIATCDECAHDWEDSVRAIDRRDDE
jgi:hypothetical protein